MHAASFELEKEFGSMIEFHAIYCLNAVSSNKTGFWGHPFSTYAKFFEKLTFLTL